MRTTLTLVLGLLIVVLLFYVGTQAIKIWA